MLGLAFAALSLPLTAHAQDGQYGDWEANWTQVDDSGNPVVNSYYDYTYGWPFQGLLTGQATPSGNYMDMLIWWSEDPDNLPLAFSPNPNPPGYPQSYLYGGPALLNNGLPVSASASNYFGIGYGHGSAFGDEQNGIPTKDVTGSISVHESNPLKLRLKWDPIYDGDDWYDGENWYDIDGNPIDPPAVPPAPDHINLLVTTDVGANAGIGNAPFLGGSVTGQGGRAASVTVSESKFGGSVTASISDADPNNASARPPDIVGHHLLQIPVNGGIAEVETDATGDAQASAPAPVGNDITYSYVTASGEVRAWAAQDDRYVFLNRDGAHDEWTDSDGNTHGDTIYSHVDTEPGRDSDGNRGDQDNDCPNWQTFHPTLVGSWSLMTDPYNPNWADWSWSPDETDDTWDTGKWKMPYGKLNMKYQEWVGSPTGASPPSAMTYTITDNYDGAKGTATYMLTVHDPIEWNSAPDSVIDLPPTPIGSCDHPVSAGSDVIVTFPPPSGTLDYSDGAKIFSIVLGTATVLPVDDPLPVLAMMLAASIGNTVGVYAPNTPNDQKTLSSSASDFAGDASNPTQIVGADASAVASNPSGWYSGSIPDNPGFWTVTGQVVEHRQLATWTGQTYDAGGHTGTTHSHANFRKDIGDGIRTWTFHSVRASGG